jgi:hypothetical protein
VATDGLIRISLLLLETGLLSLASAERRPVHLLLATSHVRGARARREAVEDLLGSFKLRVLVHSLMHLV